MAKFLIGLVTGMILTILLAVVIVFSVARFGTEKRANIPAEATLLLRIEGEIPERHPLEFPIPFFEQQLKGKGDTAFPKAWVFETGTNRWRKFDAWPPKESIRSPCCWEAGRFTARRRWTP